MKAPIVNTVMVKGGRVVCACHGWPVRWIRRRDGNGAMEGRDPIHCEHPERYLEYGDDFPDHCQACGWAAS